MGTLRAFVWIIVLVLFIGVVPAASQVDEEEFTQEGFEEPAKADSAGDAVKLFLEAQTAHEKGDLDLALELYKKAVVSEPEFPEAHYQIGAILEDRRLFKDAENAFRKAVEFRPDWTLALSRLGSVLITNGQYIEAEEVLKKSIGLDGMGFPAYIALTELYLIETPDEVKRKDLYSRLVYLSSKSSVPASIWASRAALERQNKNFGEASRSVSIALNLDKSNKMARFEEVEIAIARSDFDAAIGLAKSLDETYPAEDGPKLLTARSLVLKGNKDAAIKILEPIEPKSEAIAEMYSALKNSGEIDVTALESKISTNPRDVDSLARLCSGLRKSDPLKALDYCRRAYEIDRDNIDHAIGFAAALVQLQRYTAAVDLLERLKKSFPDNYTVRANLAISFFQLSQFENAKNEYIWITNQRPELPIGFYFLAITHDNLGEYTDAMVNYQQFLKIAGEEFQLEKERVGLRLPKLRIQLEKKK